MNEFLRSPYNFKLPYQNNLQIIFRQIIISAM